MPVTVIDKCRQFCDCVEFVINDPGVSWLGFIFIQLFSILVPPEAPIKNKLMF